MAGIRCKQCNEGFGRAFLHQKHRVATDGPVSPRRCLSPAEMAAHGWAPINGAWYARVASPQMIGKTKTAKYFARLDGRPVTNAGALF